MLAHYGLSLLKIMSLGFILTRIHCDQDADINTILQKLSTHADNWNDSELDIVTKYPDLMSTFCANLARDAGRYDQIEEGARLTAIKIDCYMLYDQTDGEPSMDTSNALTLEEAENDQAISRQRRENPDMSLDDIRALNATDFIARAQEFGSRDDWSEDQLSELISAAIRAWGSTDTWDLAHVELAGNISCGLNRGHVSDLLMTDAQRKVENVLAHLTCLKGDVMKEAHNQWYAATGTNANRYQVDDIDKLGEILCGMQENDIADIPLDVVRDRLEHIGELVSCLAYTHVAFMTKVKLVYPEPLERWNTTVFRKLGRLIGGLTRDELPRVTPTQISAMKVSALSAISRHSLNFFADETLTALKNTFINDLTDDMRTAINNIQNFQPAPTTTTRSQSTVSQPSKSHIIQMRAFGLTSVMVVAMTISLC